MTDAAAKTILIAEDEEQVRRLIIRMLSTAGYNLLVAEDGQAALEILQQHDDTVDLLLSDIVMPRMTGIELAKLCTRLRPRVKILLVSAYNEGLLVLGTGWSFLEKPFAQKALLDKVEEALS